MKKCAKRNFLYPLKCLKEISIWTELISVTKYSTIKTRSTPVIDSVPMMVSMSSERKLSKQVIGVVCGLVGQDCVKAQV